MRSGVDGALQAVLPAAVGGAGVVALAAGVERREADERVLPDAAQQAHAAGVRLVPAVDEALARHREGAQVLRVLVARGEAQHQLERHVDVQVRAEEAVGVGVADDPFLEPAAGGGVVDVADVAEAEAEALEEGRGDRGLEGGAAVGLDAARAVSRDVAQAAHEPAGDEGLLAELEAREVAVGSGGGAARRRDEEGVVDLVRRGHEVGERGDLVAEGAPPDDAVAVELGLHRLVLVGRRVPAVPVVLDARLRAELAGESEAEAEVHPVLVPLDALVDVGGVELARAERAAARHEGEPPGVRLDAALGAGVDGALVVLAPEVVEVEPAGAGEAQAASMGTKTSDEARRTIVVSWTGFAEVTKTLVSTPALRISRRGVRARGPSRSRPFFCLSVSSGQNCARAGAAAPRARARRTAAVAALATVAVAILRARCGRPIGPRV